MIELARVRPDAGNGANEILGLDEPPSEPRRDDSARDEAVDCDAGEPGRLDDAAATSSRQADVPDVPVKTALSVSLTLAVPVAGIAAVAHDQIGQCGGRTDRKAAADLARCRPCTS